MIDVGNLMDGSCMCCAHEEQVPAKGWPMVAEPKLDGFRILFFMDRSGGFKAVSRGGNSEPFTRNLQHIGEHLSALGFRDCMVDGEVSAGDWNRTAQLVRLKDPGELQLREIQASVHFNAFDVVYMDVVEAFESQRGKKTRAARRSYYGRQQDLDLLVPDDHLVVRRVRGVLCEDADQGAAAHAAHLKAGHEGTVFKQPYSTYEFDRSRQWIAVKPTETVDARVVGVVEGEVKHKGRLGALQVRTQDGTEFNVGTGFDDAERELAWLDRESLEGRWVECARQKGGAKATARHPVFLRWRTDRDGGST